MVAGKLILLSTRLALTSFGDLFMNCALVRVPDKSSDCTYMFPCWLSPCDVSRLIGFAASSSVSPGNRP